MAATKELGGVKEQLLEHQAQEIALQVQQSLSLHRLLGCILEEDTQQFTHASILQCR